MRKLKQNEPRFMRTAIALLMMVLTATTAWATTKTVSYTISYNGDTKYWLDGSDNTHYNIGSSIGMAKTYTMPMSDVTITVTSASDHCAISSYSGDESINGFFKNNYTFTFASSSYYISKITICDMVKRTEQSVDNNTKECTVNWSCSTYGLAQRIDVTLSDTKPVYIYGITYNLNDGTNAADNPQSYDNSVGVASFAAATRTGYTFGGWYDNSECTGDAVTSIAAGSIGAKTLWAKWTANTYTVVYMPNGGTGTMSNQTFTCDQAQALTANAFTREGYDFKGWGTSRTGVTRYTDSQSVRNLASKQGATVKLFAQWKAKKYRVSFIGNGHGTEPLTQQVDYGDLAKEPTVPTADGYTFGGWYTEQTCENRWEFKFCLVTGDTYLYAKWAQNVYTIDYLLDGGVNSASNPLVYTNTDNITLAEPTKTGYTFLGWTYDGQDTPTKEVRLNGDTGAKTFTAHWQVNQYTITFDTDGGTLISGSTAPITQNYGTTVTAPILAKQGYLFKGWEDLPETMPGENITVHPDWIQLYHQNRVEAGCMEDGTEEYYYGDEKYWTENNDHLTYTETDYSDLVIYATGHEYGTHQWTWGINYLGDREATFKLVCTHCGFIDSTPSQDGDITSEVTTAPTETTDGVRTYTATITVYGTEYTDTYEEAIPRLFKVAKIGSTEYSYLKDAMDAASSGDVIKLYGDVVESNTSCGVPDDYYKNIILDLNGHSVLMESIHQQGNLTVKNGSLVCNIDNAAGGNSNTLTLDNAKLTCVGVYDNEWDMWSSGIQWLAKDIAVTNGSTMYIYGGAYLGGGADDDFNLSIDGTSSVVLENAILSGYNNTRVRSQFAQYLPVGYTISNEGKVTDGSGVYTDPVTLSRSNVIILADNDNNSTVITANINNTKNVTLKDRTLTKNGDWNTLCLPFSMSAAQIAASSLAGATIKELDNSASGSNLAANGTLTLKFSTVYDPTDAPSGSIVAGKPYIVRWGTPEENPGGTIVDPVFSDVTVTSTTPEPVTFTGGSFVGQYSPFAIDDTNINSVIMLSSGNRLGYSNANRTLRSFRAHFEVPAEEHVRNFVLDFDGETTSMHNSEFIMHNEADAWYSLDGRKQDNMPTKKGLYIHGGKKVAIK